MTYLQDKIPFELIKKVLVIKLRHLGDVVLSTPVIHVLKKYYPHLEIDFLINDEGKELVSGLSEISNLITYKRKETKKGFFKKISVEKELIFKVRKAKYDLVINLTEGDKGNILAILSKAKYKAGLEGSSYQKYLTHLYKKTGLLRHSVERDLDALRRLGIYPKPEDKKLILAPFDKEKKEIESFLDKHQLKSFIALHPVSRWMYKSPEASWFIELIHKLQLPVVITGVKSGNEGAFIDKILNACPDAIHFESQGSIKNLLALLEKAKALITVDSLPLHLASYLKLPSVCLFGPTSEYDWGPWDNPKAYIVTYSKPCRACYKDGCGGGKSSLCLEEINQESVTQAVSQVLQEGG